MKVRQKTPPLERLMRRAQRQDEPGVNGVPCLLFPFSLNNGGYGSIRVDGKTRTAHKVSWEEQVGPVPVGLELDHLCRVRTCIEILHMEPVTHRENDMRGEAPAIKRHLSGVCVRGHDFTPGRQCQTCMNDAQREGYRLLRFAGHTVEYARAHRGDTAVRAALGYVDARRVG